MKIEDFAYELCDLREVARGKGMERWRKIVRLLRSHPKIGREVMIGMLAIIAMDALSIALGGFRSHYRWRRHGLGTGSALFMGAAYGFERVSSLMRVSERLNARASRLPDGELERISEALKYMPEWAQRGSVPEDARRGCYGCAKLVPVGERVCPFCKNRRWVYGDASHPLEEERLRRIHDLLLEET